MTFRLSTLTTAAIVLALSLAAFQSCSAQDSSANQSWNSSSQQGSPGGAINPTRTDQSHTESNGRVVDNTSVQTLGPDGRYIPYSDTEKESRRVNDNTVRTIERTFGRDADGRRVLIQEKQEESRTLAGGEAKVTRTISNPDANGGLQVVQRETEDSRQVSPGVRTTSTTVMTPDGNGGFSPSVQTERRETKANDGTIQFKKSTLLSDGTGGWKLSEVREGSMRQDGQAVTKEERVSRPDGEGKLALVERTVSKDGQGSSGDKRDTTETYSSNVPGVAGDGSLQLVQRETTVHRAATSGARTTTRQVEQPTPGEENGGLQVTRESIDIVRPGGGAADESHTILAPTSDGRMGQVWVDTGKTDNPAAVKVDTAPASATKPK